MVFITEAFFEVALESWPEWDLNPRPYIYHICMHIYIWKYIYISSSIFIINIYIYT